MTPEEALEYLNLPANPRKQLVRKRYLELKEDYLKAIFNAPSDHIGSLYKENLQKIEEAYNLLVESPKEDDTDLGNHEIRQNIEEIQQTVDSLFEEGGGLDPASREALKQCINQIDQLQQALQESSTAMLPKNPLISEESINAVQDSESDLASAPEDPPLPVTPSNADDIEKDSIESTVSKPEKAKTPSWRWEINEPNQAEKMEEKVEEMDWMQNEGEQLQELEQEQKRKSPTNTRKHWLPEFLKFESWFVERVSSSSQYTNSADRSYFYRKLIMFTILTVVILGALGTLYVFFPLFL